MEDVMGKKGIGIRNNNRERLRDFCLENNLTVGGTMFKHKDIHTMTWTFPNGRVKYQIDNILINRKWRTSLQDVRVRRGPDVNSDHYLVIEKIKLNLSNSTAKSKIKVSDVKKLIDINIRKNFCLKLRNRFTVQLPKKVDT